MTTNSPNPVDGDVQALIADCQAEIAEIEKMLALWGAAPYLKSQLNRQQIALAALTAKPYAYEFVTSGKKQVILNRVLPPVDMDEIIPLYTTQPAQLLRQVELPGGFSPAIGDIFDRQAPVMRRDATEGNWLHKVVVTELLRSLGHEVK